MVSEPTSIASRYVQRRVLLLSAALLALLFAITEALARTYHAREEGLAAAWYQRGNADLAAGNPEQALDDFRNSLSYGGGDAVVQLHLGEALLAAGRFTEARSYLANLWDRTPGSGQVNLDLAHVSLQTGDVEDAIRYFHGAIFGVWDKEPPVERRKVRLELCKYLLDHGRIREAQAEIAGVAADTPTDDAELRVEDGRLFLRAGEPLRALAEFEGALETNPRDSQWLAEAGQLAFEDGDYLKADTYLARSERENPSPEVHDSLERIRYVLRNDPFLAGLSEEEQTSRSWRDFQHALDRLRACGVAGSRVTSAGGSSPVFQALDQEAEGLRRRIDFASLRRDSGTRADAMRFVSDVEDATARNCGPGDSFDEALRIIEKRHEVINP